MKKTIYNILIISLIYTSCSPSFDEAVSENYLYQFEVRNYTNNIFNEGNLFIGSKNSNGDFIAIDSVKYSNIISNISPSNQYYTGDELPFTNNRSSNGYNYYKIQGEQYVVIPFPIASVGTLNIDEDKILETSENIGFMFKLSNGQEKYFNGFNLINGIDNTDRKNKICVLIHLKNNDIIGDVKSCYQY